MMINENLLKLLNKHDITFPDGVNKSDHLCVYVVDQGFGKQAAYYLYGTDGRIKDIVFSKTLIKLKSNKKPKIDSGVQQNWKDARGRKKHIKDV